MSVTDDPRQTKVAPRARAAFTLIELLAAMIASTILLASMAATVAIATHLLETPLEKEATGRNREITDRLAGDLRHATSFSMPSATEFRIVRPDPADGSSVTVDYEIVDEGLTRQRENDPVMRLSQSVPDHQSLSDGFVPAGDSPRLVSRCRAVQTAASSSATDSLTIDLPPGTHEGDLLLLCIGGSGADSFVASPETWQTAASGSRGSMRLSVLYRFHSGGSSPSVVIDAQPSSSIGAVLLAIEHVDSGSPIKWTATDTGYASTPSDWTYPTLIEPSVTDLAPLNLQVVAASGDPWHRNTLGLASFTDAGRIVAADSDSSYQASLGVTLRTGLAPSLEDTPRVWHNESGDWVQAGICLEPAP